MSHLGQSKNILKKKVEKHSKEGPKEGQKGLKPDLAGERKAQFLICCEQNMLISAAIFGICCFVSVFIAICSDLLLFDATRCYLLPLAAARC